MSVLRGSLVFNTALHRALGYRHRELTLDDIRLVINDSIQESENLDWKKQLPAKQAPQGQADSKKPHMPDREFAKDVAAMANSGGGTIVYGIEEDGTTSAAKAVTGAGEWNDGVERKLRSWAASSIEPPIYDLDIASIGTGNETVVVVNVPGSPQAPHFVSYGSGTHRVPRRTGTQTVYMAEREIEAAYRARFRGDADRETAMLAHLRRAAQRVRGDYVALAMVATPVGERQALRGMISPKEFDAILSAMRVPNRFVAASHEAIDSLGDSPKRGFRRWVVQSPRTGGYSLLEVHDNGTLVLAQQHRTSLNDDSTVNLEAYLVHSSPAFLAQLVEAAAQTLGLPGDYDVRFLMDTKARAMWIEQGRGAFATNKEDLLPISPDEPIDTVFSVTADPDVLLSQVRGLALDVLNSGGINRMYRDFLKQLATPV